MAEMAGEGFKNLRERNTFIKRDHEFCKAEKCKVSGKHVGFENRKTAV